MEDIKVIEVCRENTEEPLFLDFYLLDEWIAYSYYLGELRGYQIPPEISSPKGEPYRSHITNYIRGLNLSRRKSFSTPIVERHLEPIKFIEE